MLDKEPWQMTRAVYVGLFEGKPQFVEKGMQPSDVHEYLVSLAFSKGEPVPAEVLADYPELKARVAEPKRYIIKQEPEPLYEAGIKYVAYYEDETPRYLAAETAEALKARLLEAEPSAEFLPNPPAANLGVKTEVNKGKEGWQVTARIGDRTFKSIHYAGREGKGHAEREAERIKDGDVALLKIFGYEEVAPPAANPQAPKTIKEAPTFEGAGFRVDIENIGIPRDATAADVIRFEEGELGNILGVSRELLKELENYSARDVIWVTKEKKDAAYYLSEGMTKKDISEVTSVKGGRIIASDEQGGFLVLRAPEAGEQRLGIRAQVRASARQISDRALSNLINAVPDVNDTLEVNYWEFVGDELIYLEGWCDACLAYSGWAEASLSRKLDYLERDTPKILKHISEDRGFELVEGGFVETPDATELYGVTWGVYRVPSPITVKAKAQINEWIERNQRVKKRTPELDQSLATLQSHLTPVEVARPNPGISEAGKEPWQMTLEEYAYAFARKYGHGKPRIAYVKAGYGEAYRSHKTAVKRAIREGKPVPAEVLADYPDIKPPAVNPEIDIAKGVIKKGDKLIANPENIPAARAFIAELRRLADEAEQQALASTESKARRLMQNARQARKDADNIEMTIPKPPTAKPNPGESKAGKTEDSQLLKGILFAVGISTAAVGALAILARTFALGRQASYQQNGEYLISVRFPGEWHDIREFVQPSSPDVLAIYSQIGPDAWKLFDFVCRCVTYRLDTGEFWLTPSETLARGRADCEDTSLLLCSLLRNFTEAKVALGDYCGFGHAWCRHNGQILETTYTRAGIAPDPENYTTFVLFDDQEVIELWPGALNEIFAARRGVAG